MTYMKTPHVSSHSHHLLNRYVAYLPGCIFVALLVGFLGFLVAPYPIAENGLFFEVLGVVFLLGAPFFVLWAQRVRRHVYFTHHPYVTVDGAFLTHGPYAYSRHPTHLGLFVLSFGFAFVLNSLVMVGVLVCALVIFHTWVIPYEEKLLEKHLGRSYKNYQKKVRTWL